ncbi:MAG: sucrose synthase [Verrucomicrobiales bacterium]|nr:sucrose synthase [Verrucomicrobiales bacterium]
MAVTQTLLAEQVARCAGPLRKLLGRYRDLEKTFLLRSDLVEVFQSHCQEDPRQPLDEGPLAELFLAAQEAVVCEHCLHVASRPAVARWEFASLDMDTLEVHEATAAKFLRVKERLREPHRDPGEWLLEIDLGPFEREFPKMERSRSIGRGVEFLNRHLSHELFSDKEQGGGRWLKFLRLHQYRGQHLMLSQSVKEVAELRNALRQAHDLLDDTDPATPWGELEPRLRPLGFEAGWGDTAGRVAESMSLLADILEAPDPAGIERFLSRLPMIFNLVILSPHGFFGQANVLGKPDTGGQVVYILDQVRALEQAMRQSLREQGLAGIEPRILIVTRLIPDANGTTCDQAEERVEGTEHAWIIRVPFREANGSVVPHWISRFKIWPYLERFAREVEKEVLGRLEGRPDFIIGNYSDGNLVASILADRLGVTQCNIAHALEKTKYLYSDLYWKDHEKEHHFACQFTADLIAMNTADFIITSTYQEIAGTKDSIGQYESYMNFTLPDLYRVINGISPFDPKFNIVSPGADPNVFFPHSEKNRVPRKVREEVRTRIFGTARRDAMGGFTEKEKPLLFAMSRLDRIKNMAGLVEWYGRSKELQREANLLLVGGQFDPAKSNDAEERQQIEHLHQLIRDHRLEGRVRWVVMQTDKVRVGEFYRQVARQRGVFVQPALFEAFGLTVIEAMTSGLPVFATRYGGPLEIIQHGVSGFHIDPNHGNQAAALMADFLRQCRKKPGHWEKLSQGAITRVEQSYTWKLYARRLLSLSRVYGFWKYISNIEREESRRYLEALYGLMYRPLAGKANGA